jgi:hypothetical protein
MVMIWISIIVTANPYFRLEILYLRPSTKENKPWAIDSGDPMLGCIDEDYFRLYGSFYKLFSESNSLHPQDSGDSTCQFTSAIYPTKLRRMT